MGKKYNHLTEDRFYEYLKLIEDSTIGIGKLAKILGVSNSTLYLINKYKDWGKYREYIEARTAKKRAEKEQVSKERGDQITYAPTPEVIHPKVMAELVVALENLTVAVTDNSKAIWTLRKSINVGLNNEQESHAPWWKSPLNK